MTVPSDVTYKHCSDLNAAIFRITYFNPLYFMVVSIY